MTFAMSAHLQSINVDQGPTALPAIEYLAPSALVYEEICSDSEERRCSLVANPSVSINEDGLLLVCPGLPLDIRAKLVVPPLSALLPYTAGKVGCDRTPLAFSFCLDEPVTEQVYINVRWQRLLPWMPPSFQGRQWNTHHI